MQKIAKNHGNRAFGGTSVFRFFAAASALLALFVLLSPSLMRAQLATADVLGTVTDSTGAVVPDAKVTILNTGTGIASSANTNKLGEYLFSNVQIGTMKVTVEANGFKTFNVANLALTAGQRVRVNAVLQVGSQVETVQVEATTVAELQTDSSDINAVVPAEAISDMPTNGRNYYNLIDVQAGITSVPPNGAPNDQRVVMAFAANGQNPTYNNNMIDGLDNNERSFGTVAVEPSLDALQEVQVETSNYSAEYSRTGGGIANLITKSGTNKFHGTLFEFMRNDDFDAYQWVSAGQTKSKLELRQNQFGGSLGGPILKNRAFFFGDYQGFRKVAGGLSRELVPTQAEYDAIHAYSAGTASSITFSDPFDAWGGTSAGVTVPGDQINPLGLAYLMEAPAPNPGCASYPEGLCPGGINWEGGLNAPQNADTYDGRVDYHFNDKNTLFGRFSYNKNLSVQPGPFPETHIVAGNSHTYEPVHSFNPILTDNIALDYVHIFSPKTLFEAKASYLRMNERAYTEGITYWTLGIISSQFACGDAYCYNSSNVGGLPWFGGFDPVSSNSPYSTAQAARYGFNGDGGNQAYIENTYQYNASLTLNRRNHSIKMGVTSLRRQINAPANNNDTITFSANYTGDNLADLAEGLAVAAAGTKTLVIHYGRYWEPSAYIQDDWRATKSLTLNLGVRYDIFTPMTDRDGNISNFDPNTDLIVSPDLLGANNSGPTAGIKTYFGDVSPRIGFAYSFGNSKLLKNTVLRGGFGLSYFPANAGTPGGLHEFELLNAPFIWGMGCNAPGYGGSAPCNGSNGYISAAAYAAQPYGIPAGEYVNPATNVDYGVGGYNLQYGLPLATYNTALATNPYNYASDTAYNVFIPPNYVPSYLEQFNLQVQKQVGNNIITAGFVGNLGRHMNSMNNINQPPNPVFTHYPLYSASTPWMDNVTAEDVISGGNSKWEAGEATYERRLSQGFSASVNYTWARTATNGGQSECVLYGCPMDNGSGTALLVNGWQQYTYAGSTTLRAAGMVSYNIPFGKNLHGIAGAAVKGWALNGVGYWNNGAWGAVEDEVHDQSGLQGYSGLAGNGTAPEYPNRVPGVSTKPANRSLSHWINENAFSLQTAGMLGNAHSNDVQEPRTRDADLGLGKTFSLLEGFRLQFRAEAFNFTNTPSYAAVGGGPPGSVGALGINAFTSNNAGATATTAAGFGSIGSVSSQPRIFQFALKLLY